MTMRQLARLGARIARTNFAEASIPFRLTYAVTNRCQAKCIMCNIWRNSPSDELTLAEIDELFAKSGKFSWINLTGGEIFLRQDVDQLIATIIRRSPDLYLLNFPTNGVETETIVRTIDTILSRTSLPRLAVTVSVDGPLKLHDNIRNLPGCWEQAVETFRQLRTRRSRRFSVFLGYTLQSANIDAFETTLTDCRSKIPLLTEDDFHVNLAHVSGHYYGNDEFKGLPAPEPAIRLLDRTSRRRRSLFDAVDFLERRYRQLAPLHLFGGRVPLVCQASSASCFIGPDGTVYPCSGYPVVMGSLREHNMDLYQIWRESARLKIREQVRNGACPGCWTPCEAYQTILANLFPFKGSKG